MPLVESSNPDMVDICSEMVCCSCVNLFSAKDDFGSNTLFVT